MPATTGRQMIQEASVGKLGIRAKRRVSFLQMLVVSHFYSTDKNGMMARDGRWITESGTDQRHRFAVLYGRGGARRCLE